jgi:hypothetical protein
MCAFTSSRHHLQLRGLQRLQPKDIKRLTLASGPCYDLAVMNTHFQRRARRHGVARLLCCYRSPKSGILAA